MPYLSPNRSSTHNGLNCQSCAIIIWFSYFDLSLGDYIGRLPPWSAKGISRWIELCHSMETSRHLFWNPSMWEDSHFYYWIIFSRPLFTIIFRPKMVFLDTDSILRVKSGLEKIILKFLHAGDYFPNTS